MDNGQSRTKTSPSSTQKLILQRQMKPQLVHKQNNTFLYNLLVFKVCDGVSYFQLGFSMNSTLLTTASISCLYLLLSNLKWTSSNKQLPQKVFKVFQL